MRDRQRSRPGEWQASGSVLVGLAVLTLTGLAPALAQDLPGAGSEPLLTPLVSSFRGFEEELPGDSPTLDIHFLFAAANTFAPYDSSTTWGYGGAGCRYITGGNPWSDLDLHLPDGAILDFVRVYYYDTDATNNIGVELYSFDGAGNYTSLAVANGSGSAGYGSAGSDFFFHRVNNVAESLVLRLSSGGTTASLAACAVRVRYSPAEIFLDGFETGNTTRWSATSP